MHPNYKMEAEVQKQVKKLETLIRPYLSKEAYERYSRVKFVHPQVAIEALAHVGELAKEGRIRNLNDNDFKRILNQFTNKRDITIKRG